MIILCVLGCLLHSLGTVNAFVELHPTASLKPTQSSGGNAFIGRAPPIPLRQRKYLSFSFDPFVEAEVLSDLSHVVLDLGSVIGFANSGLSARAANVVGRILIMLADFLPDHQMRADEMMFQIPLLFLAFHALFKSAKPQIASFLQGRSKLGLGSPRDGRAYKTLFEPAGLTWTQFKYMRNDFMDWVDISPGSTFISGDAASCVNETEFVYWLYRGEVDIYNSFKHVHTLERQHKDPKSAAIGLLGEEKLLDRMNLQDPSQGAIKEGEAPRLALTAKAGAKGATLLRMNVSKVEQMVRNDEELDQSMRCLLLRGMQEKVHSYCYRSYF